jgi:hypothetical protein
MKSTFKKRYTRFVALLTVGTIAAIGAARAGGWRDDDDRLAQSAELEQLHAAFHAAVSVHDPVNGDSPSVITQRIRDAVALWTRDGEITMVSTTAAAGNYIGSGDPDDSATCPEPSGDTSATGQQGTLCTFFKYVSGGLQPANKFVSLSPAYKTNFVPVRDYDGHWKSSVYFECHYFDVSSNPATASHFGQLKATLILTVKPRRSMGSGYLRASPHPPFQFRFREAEHPMPRSPSMQRGVGIMPPPEYL